MNLNQQDLEKNMAQSEPPQNFGGVELHLLNFGKFQKAKKNGRWAVRKNQMV